MNLGRETGFHPESRRFPWNQKAGEAGGNSKAPGVDRTWKANGGSRRTGIRVKGLQIVKLMFIFARDIPEYPIMEGEAGHLQGRIWYR